MRCVIIHKTERRRKTYLKKVEVIKGTETVYYTTNIEEAQIFNTKPAANQMMKKYDILQRFAEVQKL